MLIGRVDEINAWRHVLADPGPACVVICGAQGMGKSRLMREMLAATTEHPTRDAGGILYEVVPSDSFEVIIGHMVADAYSAGSLSESSLAKTDRRREQWKALIGILPRGDKLHALVQSLWNTPGLHPRNVLLKQLEHISRTLPETGRAAFFIDAEKYFDPSHVDAWRLVVRDLPDKCKLIFSQRPDGVLISDNNFMAGANVVQIPSSSLSVLSSSEVRSLAESKATEVDVSQEQLEAAVSRYQGHPYAVTAALDLICSSADIPHLPLDPTPEKISECQWKIVCRSGKDAVQLFNALAVLNYPSPPDIVCEVAGISPEEFAALVADTRLGQFLTHDHDTDWAIYHSLLSDYIVCNPISSLEDYHRRAADVYRSRIEKSPIAAIRLPLHSKAFGGDLAYVVAVKESVPILINLGLYSTALKLIDEALTRTPASLTAFVLQTAVAEIHRRSGNLDDAETEFKAAVDGLKGLGDKRHQGIALQGLAELAGLRGDSHESEVLWREALRLCMEGGEPRGVIHCANAIGDIRLAQNDPDSAEEAFRLALAIAVDIGDHREKATTIIKFVNSARYRGNVDQVVDLLNQAKLLFQEVSYQEGVAEAHRQLGTLWHTMGRHGDALTELFVSLKIQQDLGHLLKVAECQEELAMVTLAMNNFEEADQFARLAQSVYIDLDLEVNLAKNYSLLAQIQQRRGDLGLALFMSESALRIFKVTGDTQAVLTELCNLGAIHLSRKKPTEALEIYERVLRSLGGHGSVEMLALVNHNAGVAHAMLGRIEVARNHLTQALSLYTQLNAVENASKVESFLRYLPLRRM